MVTPIKYLSIRVGEGPQRAALHTLESSAQELSQLFALRTAAPVLQVIHLVGHAWLDSGRLRSSVDGKEQPVLDVLRALNLGAHDSVLVLLDVCHAGAIAQELPQLLLRNAVVLMACSAEERTEEYTFDRATRFTLSLTQILRSRPAIDSYTLMSSFTHYRGDAIETALHPKVWSIGSGFELCASAPDQRAKTGKRRTSSVLRALYVALGAVAVAAFAWLTTWWWNTSWVQLDLGPLAASGKAWRYELLQWEIERNGKSTTRAAALVGTNLRLSVTPGSYTLRLSGEYIDGKARELNWPFVTRAHILPGQKTLALQLPNAGSLATVAEMAWISTPQRVALGRDAELHPPPAPFWIDTFPIRTRQVWGTQADAQIAETAQVENALQHLPAGNLPQLVGDMKDIMSHLDAETENLRSQDPEQFPSVMLRATKTPCEECPAPVSKDDAIHWCEQRGGRLPTPEEWQLAARGVDGRLYPWGNRFDRAKANIVGFSAKGEVMALTSADAFPQGVSAFGLWDTVGNSGEWVDDGETGLMQAGGGYWNDRDGATVYALDPSSGAHLAHEIGFRCVVLGNGGD